VRKLFGTAIGLTTLLIPSAAMADTISVTPLLDLRLRHEFVGQQGFTRDSNGTTFRIRAGAQAAAGVWRLLAEGEATLPLLQHYDSGLNGRNSYPLISDPKTLELNRAQLQYRGLPKTTVTAGRQRILMEDQRFVGNSGWRQNEQTFDALRFEYGDAKGLKADLVYSWSVRTIWGRDGFGARQRAVDGDYIFGNLAYPTPVGTLSALLILIDQKEPTASQYRQSSKTLGIRFAGAKPLSSGAKLTYALSYAAQADYKRNPNNYRADYLLTEAGIESGSWKLGLGREVLGAGEGSPSTSFQTPLATLHKFQGWADKFVATPGNGIRDLYASAGHGWTKVLGLDSIAPAVTYHRFNSDRLDLHYGDEWNAIVAAKKGHWTATAKFARYDADDFATDTTKAWLQVDWAY